MLTTYLFDIVILLSAAVIVVPFFQIVRFGAVPGFLIAGVIVGPSGFGVINNIAEITHLSEIGVVLLLFVIGIELKPSRLWLMRRLVFGIGTLQVILTSALLTGIAYLFFDVSLRAAILIGPALALSSTAFVLQLLTEQKLLNTNYGRTSFAILLLQDLAVVPLLVLVPLLAMPELSVSQDIGLALLESLVLLMVVILFGRFFLHPVLHRVAVCGNSEVFTASALLIVLGTALLFKNIGLSMAMGAFLAGLLISDSSYKHQVMAEIQPFRGLLLGLFFMSMGMSLNMPLFLEKPLSVMALVAGLMFLKIIIIFPITYLFGLKFKNSVAIALILSQSGEFALVLFSLAYQSQLLSPQLYQYLLLVVLLSILMTPILAHYAQRLVKSKVMSESKYTENVVNEAMVDEAIVKSPIVLAGFGRVGHRIGELLTIAEKPFVALDIDANTVEKERAKGHPVFYGDASNPEILKTIGAQNAEIVIVTLNDANTVERMVTSLRKNHSQIKIYARGECLEQCQKLKAIGAFVAVSENLEASMELTRNVLKQVGMDEEKYTVIIESFRKKYHAKIEQTVQTEDDESCKIKGA